MPSAPTGQPREHLQIHVLGELQVCRAGAALPLPASRKTRALLAYLAVTAKRHRRSELCGLFWEDAADPRAGLRWGLTQLRHALGERGGEAIEADRDSVALRAGMVATDLARLARLAPGTGGNDRPVRAALIEANGLFRGEFLDGLDLPGCYVYHEWCMAEREVASSRREQILEALVDCHRDEPEQALVYARALVAQNPLNEDGHVRLMKLLAALGRRRDALAQYEQCCRIFEKALDLGPPAALALARAELGSATEDRSSDSPARAAAPVDVAARARPPLIGRDGELAQLSASVERLATGRGTDVVLVSGAPGIGKSRLLGEIEHRIAAAGGRSLRGRAFEAEMLRPFGFWIDALRGLRDGDLPQPLQAAIRPLTHAGAGELLAGASGRDRLFDAVQQALSHLAQSGPLAVLVDNLHWIEASSTALLHFAMRGLAGTPVLFALTGRAGELEDNAAAQQLIAALAHSRQLLRIALGPLRDEDARSLLGGATDAAMGGVMGGVMQGADVERIVAQAQGNPLILLELARAHDAGGAPEGLLDRILETRISRLSPGAGELLDWASAFGREFPLDALVAAHGVDSGLACRQLSELERHDLISAVGDAGYEFSHDLIRQAAYSRVSQPRRRLMHKSIANHLAVGMEARPHALGEIVHHAGLGGLHVLAAQAAAGAGEHSLRVFANREAAAVAGRGLRHAAHIEDKALRAGLAMSLLRIQVLATSGQPLDRLRPDAAAIDEAIDAARASRLHDEVAQGYYLLSVVHQEAGRLDAAQQATLRAAQASGSSDGLGRARQLANSARCLVELGRDVARARELLGEARSLAEAAGTHEIEVRWCAGLLHHWDGDADGAAREIDAAIALAAAAEDRWRQCKCLAWSALIELERGRPQQAHARATALKSAASVLGEAADEPFAQVIEALTAPDADGQTGRLDAALERLRAADDKPRLACALNLAAALELQRSGLDAAGTIAAEALEVAEAIGEASEAAVAQATLAQVAIAQDDPQRAAVVLDRLRSMIEVPDAVSARALKAAADAVRAAACTRAA